MKSSAYLTTADAPSMRIAAKTAMIALLSSTAMSADTVSIRRADPRDASELARLAAELGYQASVAAMRSRLDLLADRDHAVFVADEASAPLLGWIHVARRIALESGESAEILRLVVAAAARRRGVGKRLVAVAEVWSRDRGLGRIIVRSNVARTESHEFYRGMLICYDNNVIENVRATACSHGKLALAGGRRYREARKPELYRQVLGAEHRSQLTIGWMPAERPSE